MTTKVFNDCPATFHSVEMVELWIARFTSMSLEGESLPVILCNNGVCEYALESEND